MNKILFIFPTVFEGRAPLKRFGLTAKIEVGTYAELFFDEDTSLAALVSGFGCEASKKRMAAAIKNFAPNKIVLAGFCGACAPQLKNGQVIAEITAEDADVLAVLEKLGARRCKIACANHIAEKAEKEKLSERGYAGVEMESDFLKQAMAENGNTAELFHLRWISDSLESDIPAAFFESAMDMATGKIFPKPMKIFWSILKSPKLLFSLIKFAKETAPVQKKYDAEIVLVLETFARK